MVIFIPWDRIESIKKSPPLNKSNIHGAFVCGISLGLMVESVTPLSLYKQTEKTKLLEGCPIKVHHGPAFRSSRGPRVVVGPGKESANRETNGPQSILIPF